MIDSLIGDVTNETLSYMFKQIKRKRNQKRIAYIVDFIMGLAIKRIQPYMYAIMAILIVLFAMNCFQFYYYIRLFIDSKNQNTVIPIPDMSSII